MNTNTKDIVTVILALIAVIAGALLIGYIIGLNAPHPMTYTQHVDNRNYTCTLTVSRNGQVLDSCHVAG